MQQQQQPTPPRPLIESLRVSKNLPILLTGEALS